MATAHALTADTRMEDLPGLASGDTIALGGHVLTCESNLSAITGLCATGTGTIRLLDGANCDFSGSNPLPATVTIEGGTEDNPLPAHGDYGYPCRAAACITLREALFYGRVFSHCVGNSSRPHAARVVASSGTGVTLDRNMNLEAGDVLAILPEASISLAPYVEVSDWNPAVLHASHASRVAIPVGSWVALATAGFVIQNARFGGPVRGDEVARVGGTSGSAACLASNNIALKRLVCIFRAGNTDNPLLRQIVFGMCNIVANTIVSPVTFGSGSYPLFVSCGRLFITTINTSKPLFATISSNCGVLSFGTNTSSIWGLPTGGCLSLTDMVLPPTLYTSLTYTDEINIRSTDPQSCTVHRAGGIATLVDRTDIEVPTSLPDAWRLDPIEDGTAWHDVPMTVLPGKTLSCIWYWMLGEEGATAGCQILDGECPGWGSIAMNPGMADVLTETAVPDGASPLRPFVAVPISWRNPGREIRKVVLRGWARGGTAYSRIDPAAGGLA